MTSQYELILLTDEITPEQEDAIYEEYDALVSSHTGASRLTVTVEGRTVIDGARRLLAFLHACGVQPQQFCEDFVTRADIADRANVTRQAVGLWVRGERHQAFPRTYSVAAGGLWLFADVDAWLRANIPSYSAPEHSYPTRQDHHELNELLMQTTSRATFHVDLAWRPEVDLNTTDSAPRQPVDRHAHSWSKVAQVRGVDMTLAA